MTHSLAWSELQAYHLLMIILGIILLVLGWILPMPVLTTIGFILLVIGLVLLVAGAAGNPVGGRRYWY